jgi:hypothetical protein
MEKRIHCTTYHVWLHKQYNYVLVSQQTANTMEPSQFLLLPCELVLSAGSTHFCSMGKKNVIFISMAIQKSGCKTLNNNYPQTIPILRTRTLLAPDMLSASSRMHPLHNVRHAFCPHHRAAASNWVHKNYNGSSFS